jgi:hypothetical protein
MRRALLCLIVLAGLLAISGGPAGASSSSVVWDFFSAPKLHPPRLQVLVQKPGLEQGEFLATGQQIMTGPGTSVGEAGPLLLDSDAQPVWFLPLNDAFDLQQETYRGKPVLVVYTEPGRNSNAGKIEIYNEHYRRIATIRARSPWGIDLHDAWITGGDIWITVTRQVTDRNLKPYGGPRNGSISDSGLQEFQVSTGRLLRTWDALNPHGKANVPLSATHQGVGRTGNLDAYHLNSVEALPDGYLLLSMRNTWALYLLDPKTGRILWTLGGKDSSIHVPHAARFAWQHDARMTNPASNGQGKHVKLTLFDDNTDRGAARGLILGVNSITHRATLIAAYPHDPPYTASSLGSVQVLPDGNVLVDWGSPYAYFSEFTANGKQLLNVAWPRRDGSYRTLFTNTWVGTPYYPPSGAVQGTTVYASWNGATQVSRWEVMAGPSSGKLSVVASHARTGFETAITLGQSYGTYEVRALSAAGAVLGTSKAFS